MTEPAQLAFSFPPPVSDSVDVLVIAGEHSGDEHAARMIRGALDREPDLKVCCLGGRHLQAAGAQLLFDLTQYSVVGFFEVLKHYKELKSLFEEVLRWIREHKPRAVCFVDYPGMNLRIAKKLFEEGIASRAGGSTKLLYYISPQVWAWKEKRKFDMGRMLDSLGVIFPFEVEVFNNTGLETRFVGHPFVSSEYDLPVHYDPSAPILLLPGSRKAAIGRIAPVLFGAFRECVSRRKSLTATCIYASEDLLELLESILKNYGDLARHITFRPNTDAIGARAVLTSSGTMSLNCALANIPGAIVYRTHPITYAMGRLLVKIPYIGIANLLLKKPLYPEYVQGAANRKRLADEITDCIENVERLKQTRNWAAELRNLLDQPSKGGVSQWLLENLEQSSRPGKRY